MFLLISKDVSLIVTCRVRINLVFLKVLCFIDLAEVVITQWTAIATLLTVTCKLVTVHWLTVMFEV